MNHPTEPVESGVPPNRFPWLTISAVVWCVLVWAAITAESEKRGLISETMRKWGAVSGHDVWQGKYSALLSSVFVHTELWHLAGNCFWLMWFGTLLERRLGKLWYLLFFATSAFVSSTFQLGASGEIGFGASGVVYAMFGLLLPLRKRWREVDEFMSGYVIALSLVWLVACVILTRLNLMPIANAAHFAGLTFGLAISGRIRGWRTSLFTTATVGHVALSLLFLVWCPWSTAWLAQQAYKLHAERRYHEAIQVYSKIIDMEPEKSWAYHNRASANQSLGREREAASNLETATKLDARAAK
jgi:rhomboid protease GluP